MAYWLFKSEPDDYSIDDLEPYNTFGAVCELTCPRGKPQPIYGMLDLKYIFSRAVYETTETKNKARCGSRLVTPIFN